jgi:hypothetical protein
MNLEDSHYDKLDTVSAFHKDCTYKGLKNLKENYVYIYAPRAIRSPFS